ncbi:hypothetical protein OUZ56_005866 [Daphnia magna]|uniref:Ig-like domain-containing protein n=1 Tax=Daphnia magna TaxID=35525 RepID=A0ABQ9YTZ1_9CRUS|nr:hypothetical protein OUZ56_005866 [Daphnia magna]
MNVILDLKERLGSNATGRGMWNTVESSSTSAVSTATTNNLITSSPNGSLTLHTFRPEQFRPDVHAGPYRLLAANFIGRILSTPVRVHAGLLIQKWQPSAWDGGCNLQRLKWRNGLQFLKVGKVPRKNERHVMLANGDLQANNDQFHCWTNHPQSRIQDKDGTSHCRNCESNSKFGVDEMPFYLVFFTDIFRIKSNGTKVKRFSMAICCCHCRITNVERRRRRIECTAHLSRRSRNVRHHHVSFLRPVVSWLKDGQRFLVGNSGRVSSSSGDDGYTDMVQLSISSVQREDEGIYQCLASNDEGDWAQASAQLAIGAFPPHLKETFSRQVVHPGSSVSLKCLASGTPLPHFTWTLDGFPLSPVSERYFLAQQQQTDGGNYKYVAENRVGRVEHSANLHIYGAPYVRRMSTVVGVGGKRLELPCPVAGYPIEAITWEKDGRRLPLNGRRRLQFNGSLTIDPLDKSSDAGLYSCEARGQNGLSARQSLQLNILALRKY